MTNLPSLTDPILFTAIYKEKIWGGRNLAAAIGKPLPPGLRIGESWELSGYGAETSVAASGPFCGLTLAEILSEHCAGVLGSAHDAPFFPLLFKFIDANDKLSVQVHPDDIQARQYQWGNFGKTECWYIADVKAGGDIIVGFKKGVGIRDVEEGIRSDTLDALLNHIQIAPGDVLYIPAGTVHAICDGTLIYEVQETSDITLRLYDWGRVDDDGKPRQLHVADSLKVLDFVSHDEHRIAPVLVADTQAANHYFRVACRYFALEEYVAAHSSEITLQPKQSFAVITVLEGSIEIPGDNGLRTVIAQGQTALLPAAGCRRQVPVAFAGPGRFLVATVPGLQTEVVDFLRKQGVEDARIRALGGNALRNDLLPLLS